MQAFLLIPLGVIFTGALLALAAGVTGLSRRIAPSHLCNGLALAPLIAFVVLLFTIDDLQAGMVLTWQHNWIPALGLTTGLFFDSLSALFALLITLIGTLIVIYTGQYFKEDATVWRFLTYLLLFMGAMLGIVMAGDVLTLFVFWEGTSIVSFLLVAYKSESRKARRGAFKALVITGGGGVALLLGLLTVAQVADGTRWITILDCGEALRESSLYLVMLLLVCLGAFTKSAQFPFHIWLPDAMSAPTPASAYLHSATMVKAGIYLLARLNPVLGLTETWFWLLTLAGLMTMLTGAIQGLRRNDLKALLAYSTVCQLGMLTMMIGQDMAIAFKALVIGILAHALYKSALFMSAGIVDHETGTRDIRRLGGLCRPMPFTFCVALVAALSMAGLPPLFGFLAKETLLATAIHPTLPQWLAWILTLASVTTGALMLAMSGLLIWETFLGKPKDEGLHAHEAPWLMLLPPAIPAALSIVIGLLPGPKQEAILLANAAGAAFGQRLKVSLALWTGLNIPLLLSMLAISAGVVIFIHRHQVRNLLAAMAVKTNLNQGFAALLLALDALAHLATRLQRGQLRIYMLIIGGATILLTLRMGGAPWLPQPYHFSAPTMAFAGELALLEIFVLAVIVISAGATILLKKDFNAILGLGALGLGIALYMVLETAPDLALVQVVVDLLSLVILVLAIARMPAKLFRRARYAEEGQGPWDWIATAVVAAGFGLVMTLITLSALISRPRESVVTPFYTILAKELTGATNVVGAIIVDFRALDTFMEIAVFSAAGVGVYTLLRFAAITHRDHCNGTDPAGPGSHWPINIQGIGGGHTSDFIKALALVALPLAMVIAVTQLMYGHDMPGDGFTAGVIVSLALGFWYMVYGYHEMQVRIHWLRPGLFIGSGLLLVLLTGGLGALVQGSFLANLDAESYFHLPLPRGFHISTSFLFEIAICLCVVGSSLYILNTLGHPGERDRESVECLQAMGADKTLVPAPGKRPATIHKTNAHTGREES